MNETRLNFTVFIRARGDLQDGAVVIAVDDGDGRIAETDALQHEPDRAVVLLGEVVEPSDAPGVIVVAGVVALEHGEVPRHAAYGEVPGDDDCLRSKADQHLMYII